MNKSVAACLYFSQSKSMAFGGDWVGPCVSRIHFRIKINDGEILPFRLQLEFSFHADTIFVI